MSCPPPQADETPFGNRTGAAYLAGVASPAPAHRSRHARPGSVPRQSPRLLALAVPLLALGLCGCSLLGGLIGAVLPLASTKMAFSCIPARTAVDTPSGPRAIEELEAGDSVIGFSGQPVRILQKHSYLEDPETVFLHLTFADGAAVDLCGMHRVAGVRARNLQLGQTIAGRRLTSVDSHRGETRSYDLLTEDAGYQVQGVPVNSMIEEMHAAAASGMRSVRD